MYGRTIPFVLVILSLLVIDIYGIRPKEDTQRCRNGGTPNGRCVLSVTNQCAGGFFCQDVPGDITGICCPTRIVQPPLDTRRCPSGTPVSRDCNPWMFPSSCPNGYRCYSPTDGPGLCCPYIAKGTCPSGGNPAGPCSSFGVDQCPSGHFCSSTSVDGSGTCCPLDMPILPIRCRNGATPNGRCVLSVTNQCAGGFFCQDVPGDRTGICCPTRIVQPPLGSCPVVNRVGPCVILPGHCVSDDECRQGQRCCPDGCGKMCKYVGGDSYIPRSDLKG